MPKPVGQLYFYIYIFKKSYSWKVMEDEIFYYYKSVMSPIHLTFQIPLQRSISHSSASVLICSMWSSFENASLAFISNVDEALRLPAIACLKKLFLDIIVWWLVHSFPSQSLKNYQLQHTQIMLPPLSLISKQVIHS